MCNNYWDKEFVNIEFNYLCPLDEFREALRLLKENNKTTKDKVK